MLHLPTLEDTFGNKDVLLRQMITKVCEQGKIEPALKKFFNESHFLGNYALVCQNILDRYNDGNMPSLAFIRNRYRIRESVTEMNQVDISEALRIIYLKEVFALKYAENLKSIEHGEMTEIKSFIQYLQDTIIKMENVEMANFSDIERMRRVMFDITDESNVQRFGRLTGFNALKMRPKMVVGILAASENAKSLTMQKLHAESKDSIVLHFSLELSEAMFIERMISALGWIKSSQIRKLSNSEIEHYVKRLATEFPRWHYTCLDTDSGIINVAKIENRIKYYRTIYGDDEPIRVFIDYVQLLEENFDANTCRVNKQIHDIAVRYNVLIIEGLQGNDEASRYEHCPETSMIAFVRSLKNDCDIIQSQKVEKSLDGKTYIRSTSKKHRGQSPVSFSYIVDPEAEGQTWKLNGRVKGLRNDEFIEENDYEVLIDEDNPKIAQLKFSKK